MRRFLNQKMSTRRRGAVIVLVAISMVTLMLFGALAVDVGYICSLVAEMQNTADASSLSGASALQDGKYDDWKERTYGLLARNQKLQGFQSLDDQVVQVGRWDRATMTFTPVAADAANRANSVRVVSHRHKVPLFFAALMGKHATNVSREAVAYVTPTCGGIWGFEGVDVPGSVYVDSYESTDGNYSMATAGENGDVCSNADLTVNGSVEIHGDTLGAPVTVKGGAALVTGYVDTLDKPVTPPTIDFGDVAINNDNASIGTTDGGSNPFSSDANIQITANDNLTLNGGKYYFESVEFHSGATLTIAGPTEIYLTGDFDATGNGLVNTTGDPHDLTIYAKSGNVHIGGGYNFYGSIWAVDSEVKLAGNVTFYGAVVANTVKIAGNVTFHVDESLDLVHSLKPPPELVR